MDKSYSVKLITFGGDGRNYVNSAQRVARDGLKFDAISSASAFCESDLDEAYDQLFPNFAERYPRGFGLWSWKPYLVSRELRKLPEGDVLLYVDGGCELNSLGLSRFDAYLQFVEQNDVLVFELTHKNKLFTKSHLEFSAIDGFGESMQISATILFLKKCKRTQEFVDDWLAMCAANDGELLKDVDKSTQSPEFVDHRHDQSVLTFVARKLGIKPLPDDTYVEKPKFLFGWPKYARRALKQPILTMRNREGMSQIPILRFLAKFQLIATSNSRL